MPDVELDWADWSGGCLGPLHVSGLDSPVYLIPSPPTSNAGATARIGTPRGASSSESTTATAVELSHGSRLYFGHSSTCQAVSSSYSAWSLIDKTISFTADVSEAGCGCNAAVSAVSMAQNEAIGTCNDYYCDSNAICGVHCTEIDWLQANTHAIRTTAHTAEDGDGNAAGIGGELPSNAFESELYGPAASATIMRRVIDTSAPFRVSVAFRAAGRFTSPGAEELATPKLASIEVTVEQGESSRLQYVLDDVYLASIYDAVAAGMTPTLSFWSSDDLDWFEGGVCRESYPDACHAGSVSFSGFGITPIEPEEDEDDLDEGEAGGGGDGGGGGFGEDGPDSYSYDDWRDTAKQTGEAASTFGAMGVIMTGQPTKIGTPLQLVAARLSSTITGGSAAFCSASRCIDGDFTTHKYCAAGSSMCHSSIGTENPWLEVDLGGTVTGPSNQNQSTTPRRAAGRQRSKATTTRSLRAVPSPRFPSIVAGAAHARRHLQPPRLLPGAPRQLRGVAR